MSTYDDVEQGINDAIGRAGEMVTGWISLIETIDADGERAVWLLSPDTAKVWDNLGLLTYATQLEQARITVRMSQEDQ